MWDKNVTTRTIYAIAFFNHMHRFMPTLVRRHGGIVIGVPVAHRPRIVGASKYRILDRMLVGIYDIIGVIWLLRRGPAQGRVTEIIVPKTGHPSIAKKVGKKPSKRLSKSIKRPWGRSAMITFCPIQSKLRSVPLPLGCWRSSLPAFQHCHPPRTNHGDDWFCWPRTVCYALYCAMVDIRGPRWSVIPIAFWYFLVVVQCCCFMRSGDRIR